MDGYLVGDGKERIGDPESPEPATKRSLVSPCLLGTLWAISSLGCSPKRHQHSLPLHPKSSSNFKALSGPSWVGKSRKEEGIIFSPFLGRGCKVGA